MLTTKCHNLPLSAMDGGNPAAPPPSAGGQTLPAPCGTSRRRSQKIHRQKQCPSVVRIVRAVRQALQYDIDGDEVLRQPEGAATMGALLRGGEQWGHVVQGALKAGVVPGIRRQGGSWDGGAVAGAAPSKKGTYLLERFCFLY